LKYLESKELEWFTGFDSEESFLEKYSLQKSMTDACKSLKVVFGSNVGGGFINGQNLINRLNRTRDALSA